MVKRKWAFRLGFLVLLLPSLLVMLSIGLAEAPPEPPSMDLAIALPGGHEETLGAILEEAARQGAAESEAESVAPFGPGPGDPIREVLPQVPEIGEWWPLESAEDRDPYRLGRYLAMHGNVEGAIAVLRSVPEGHPEFARSQRFLGWDLYTQELGEPRIGLTFVNKSLRAAPFDGNAWQDSYRTLGRSFLP